MLNRGKLSLLLFVVLLSIGSIAWAKPRVAIMDFDNRSQAGGYSVGRGASDMLSTELVKKNTFSVMERDRLSAILKEQNLGASGNVDPTTAAKIGKLIGVEYIVTGAVTEYGESKASGGGGGINIGKKGYHAAVDIRIIDSTTGEIVFADTGEHSVSKPTVKVFGFGGGESYNSKTATEVLREALSQLSDKMSSASFIKEKASRSAAAVASKTVLVADVDGKMVSFNGGTETGLQDGDEVGIYRKGKVIKDPATGKVLKVKYKKVGTVKITEALSGYSEGRVTEGSGFQVGDEIRK